MELYKKYRPDNLNDVRGNTEVLSTISTMLEKKKFPHTTLLHGPTGCGKTTLARIIAKELKCKGHDLQEVDFADFRGIDAVRDIKKKVHYMPLEGECRVWIIDECHKMTKDAQNAFLKILEDTPKHVYFILCTTDPKDLLSTVKGRCSKYQVSLLREKEMFSLLKKTAKAEGVKVKADVLEYIATQSEGHPRNALQTLEQVLNAPPEERIAIAKQAAEITTNVIELCRLLIKGKAANWKQVSTILTGLKDQEPETIRRVVLGYMNTILLKGKNDTAAEIMEDFLEPFYDTGFPGLTYACYTAMK